MEGSFHLLVSKKMKTIKISEYQSQNLIYELWNKEYGTIFPISEPLFRRNLSNAYDNATLVVVDQDLPVGFIIGKIWKDKYNIKDYQNYGWISLIYVCPKYRKQGIGSKLLEIVESEFKRLGKSTIFLGKDYYNYFPGLPVDLKNSLPWFNNRGYIRQYYTFDLINKKIKEFLPVTNKQYTFRLATKSDQLETIQFMNDNWPGRWTKEVVDYWDNGGTGREYLLCLDNEKIIAFAKVNHPNTLEILMGYSLTWRNRFDSLGGIGPLGVNNEYRGKHLGWDIVAKAYNILIEEHASEIIIDWTGLLDFYRPLGFEVWKSYYYLKKEINTNEN